MAGRSSKGKDRAEDAVNCVGNRKRALIKTIKILVCLAALLVVFFTAAAATVYIYGSRRVVSAEDAASFNADCILVLGCGVRPDKTPSLMLADRLDRITPSPQGSRPVIYSWITQGFQHMTACTEPRRSFRPKG